MIQKGTKALLALYVIFAVTLWSLDFFEVDVTPLIDWLGLPPDFLGATGIASGVGLTTYQVIRTTQLGIQAKSQYAIKNVNETAIGLLSKVTESNDKQAKLERKINELTELTKRVIEFEKILAEKNKHSKLLNEESKQQLETWIHTTDLRIREIENENI